MRVTKIKSESMMLKSSIMLKVDVCVNSVLETEELKIFRRRLFFSARRVH